MRHFLLLLLCVCSAFAQTKIGTAAAALAIGSTSTTNTFTTTTGQFLTGIVVHESKTIASIATVSNTCTVLKVATDVTQIGEADYFQCVNITGNTSDAVTATLSGGTSILFGIALIQYSGVASLPLDQTAYGFSSSPFTTQSTSAFTTT